MDITQAIGTLGFPIAACMACGWYIVKVQQKHDDTIAKLADIINNNTLAITKLSEKIDIEKKVMS